MEGSDLTPLFIPRGFQSLPAVPLRHPPRNRALPQTRAWPYQQAAPARALAGKSRGSKAFWTQGQVTVRGQSMVLT